MITEDDLLYQVCGFCGMALLRREVAAYFQGLYVDYDMRDSETGAWFVLCGECRDRVMFAMNPDNMEAAVERRIRMENEREML